jgi:protein-S-isoprenylcysteine O-methyltransferase Ste14
MIRASAFILVSAFFVYVSRKSLFRPCSHGFYRFFAWEFILALVLLNASYWFKNPFSPQQLVSWFLLLVSVFLAVHGMHLLRMIGKPNQDRSNDELFAFEKTSALVTVGAYKYIRHPLYSSLLFFAWGTFLKRPSWLGLVLAFFSSLFLLLTAKTDEVECLRHFGAEYQTYMQGTKRFVPFLF